MANRTDYLKMYMLARGTHTHHFDVLRVQILKIEHIALNTKKKLYRPVRYPIAQVWIAFISLKR